MRKTKKRLSPLEWEVMNTIWALRKNPSVREVLEKAYPSGEKAYTTVQTVMNNLEAKGFLEKDKIGLVNFYKPLRKRNELLKKETANFVEKTFGGSFQRLASYLIDSGTLSAEEIADLKRVISEREKERKKR
jgi:predicted transcriptional regulator